MEISLNMLLTGILHVFVYRIFHQMAEDQSSHTVSCDHCMDPGTLLHVVDKLNASERVGKIQAVQRYMILVQRIFNSGRPICGSYGAGKCSCSFVFISVLAFLTLAGSLVIS